MTIYALGMWDPKESTPSQFLNAMFCASVACAAEIGWSRMAYTSFSRCSRQRKKGWGLRTLEFIPKGRFVCEYAGEVLGFSEVQRRIHLQTSHDSNYIIAVREHIYSGQIMETFVDPTYIGNIGRFLNHSCEPNLLMIPVRIDSMVPKLALFAAKDILPGEELSYDYSGRFLNQVSSKDKEKIDCSPPRKPCYCGAQSCTTFLPYDSSLYMAP